MWLSWTGVLYCGLLLFGVSVLANPKADAYRESLGTTIEGCLALEAADFALRHP